MVVLGASLGLRWRKPWGGPLVIQWRSLLCRGQIVFTSSTVAFSYGIGPWHYQRLATCLPCLTPLDRDLLPRVQLAHRLVRAITPQLQIRRQQAWIQLGLSDPAATGWVWGLLRTLPPPLHSQIQLSFTQIGWRSRGQITLVGRRLGLAMGLAQMGLRSLAQNPCHRR